MDNVIFEYEEALKRCLNDKELLKELIGDYFDQYLDFKVKIDEAFENNDIETLKVKSHSLKGSSANLGFNKIADCFGQIEEMCENGSTEQYLKIINLIEEHFEELKILLKEKGLLD